LEYVEWRGRVKIKIGYFGEASQRRICLINSEIHSGFPYIFLCWKAILITADLTSSDILKVTDFILSNKIKAIINLSQKNVRSEVLENYIPHTVNFVLLIVGVSSATLE